MTINIFVALLLFTVLSIVPHSKCEWHAHAGPWVNATEGELWPSSRSSIKYGQNYLLLNVSSFKFEVEESLQDEICDILTDALRRYREIITNESKVPSSSTDQPQLQLKDDNKFLGFLTVVEVVIYNRHSCQQMPSISMDESYTLEVYNKVSKKAVLKANEIWGILRGLETFSQLLVPWKESLILKINDQKHEDMPMFKHRGLLLDTSRHYLPLSDILLTLNAMSYNKLNVLHWHIVDDNSFPYVSTTFPNLSAKGAYHYTMVYTHENIKKVINYARLRGIRVIAEFDTPGHTASWGLAHPELLTVCYDNNTPNGILGPINPINPTVYYFIEQLFDEVTHVFPDRYFHIGGDEVLFDCWESNPNITAYQSKHNITDIRILEEIYIQKVLNITASFNVTPIVWQEVFDNNVEISPDTVVHVWTGNWQQKLEEVTKKGYPALLSTCWYLDHVKGGGDWKKFYSCDPLDFYSNHKELVIGGEACMWGEFVDKNNIHSRIWPRASAVAEVLWAYNSQNHEWAARRLEEHACRMNRRGIPAQPPNGAGFCIT